MRQRYRLKSSSDAFTLVEVLIVMGIVGILTAGLLVAVNPGRQFCATENLRRIEGVNAIDDALKAYIAEGVTAGTLTNLSSLAGSTIRLCTDSLGPMTIGTEGVNLASILVPNHLSALPLDSTSNDQANTGYTICRDTGVNFKVRSTSYNPSCDQTGSPFDFLASTPDTPTPTGTVTLIPTLVASGTPTSTPVLTNTPTPVNTLVPTGTQTPTPTPPTGGLTASSTSVTTGTSITFTGTVTAATAAKSVRIFVTTNVNTLPVGCVAPNIFDQWCRIAESTNSPVVGAWAPPAGVTGEYVAVINIYNNNTYAYAPDQACTGNPFFVQGPGNWRDCGTSDSVIITATDPTGTITPTVTPTHTPTATPLPQTPTNSPTPLPTIATPTNLSPGSGTFAGLRRPITWDALGGATYSIRIDDQSNGWNGSCSSPNSGDVCVNGLTTNSYDFTFYQTKTYTIWVHNVVGRRYSASASSVVGPISPYVTPTGITPLTACKVTFQYPVGVSISTNTITRNDGTNGYNAGASSVQSIPAGQYGYAQGTFPSAAPNTIIGLSDYDTDANYTSIDYAIFNEASTIRIYESGTLRSTPTLSPVFATTDLWRVEKDYYGVVRYYRNPAGTGSWTLLYTSTVPANQTLPYFYDTTIYHNSYAINDAYLYTGDSTCGAVPTPTYFASPTGTKPNSNACWPTAQNVVNVTQAGNNFRKTAGGANTWDAGFSSTQTIPAGQYGYAQFRAGHLAQGIMFGLNDTDANQGYAEIDYAMHLSSDGNPYIFQLGANVTSWLWNPGAYAIGDTYRVEKDQYGVVRYYKNTQNTNVWNLMYTSQTIANQATAYRLDTSFGDVSAVIDNVFLYTGGPTHNTGCMGSPTPSPLFTPTDGAGASPIVACKVTFQYPVGVSISTNTITRNDGTNGYNAGASSVQSIPAGQYGYAQGTFPSVAPYTIIGLSDYDTDANYTSIDYAIFNESSTIRIYESGTLRSTPTLSPVFATTDLWRVEKDYYGVVRYYRNPAGTGSWTLLYTSTVPANQSLPYFYDATIYNNTYTINGAYLYTGDATCGAVPTPTYFASPTGTKPNSNACWPTAVNPTGVLGAGNNYRKTTASSAWDSGFSSSQSIPAGQYGYVQARVGHLAQYVSFGLNDSDATRGQTELDYSFYFDNVNGVTIYELGANKTPLLWSPGAYAVGDTYRVEKDQYGVVRYYKNTQNTNVWSLIYTSATIASSSTVFYLDTSFYDQSSVLDNVYLYNGGPTHNTGCMGSPTPSPLFTPTDAASASPLTACKVTFQYPVGVSISTNNITRNDGSNGYNAGASSVQSIPAGSYGYAQGRFPSTAPYLFIGLSDYDTDANYTSIDYAVWGQAGTAYIYESGTSRGAVGTYTTADLFRVEKDYYGVVRYYKNPSGTGSWTLLYTSTVPANQSLPYVYDTTIYHNTYTINDAYLYTGDSTCAAVPTPTYFASPTGTKPNSNACWPTAVNPTGVLGAGNNYRKTTASSAWDSGFSSSQSIPAGQYGYVQARVGHLAQDVMFGLNDSDAIRSYTELDYSIYFTGSSTIQVYELGAEKSAGFLWAPGTYAVGDTYRIEKDQYGVVRYYKNTQNTNVWSLFYTSQTIASSSTVFYLDTSFYTQTAVLDNVYLYNGGPTHNTGCMGSPTPSPLFTPTDAASASPIVACKVTFQNLLNATASTNNITRNGGNGYDAGGSSVQSIPAGQYGYAQGRFPSGGVYHIIGLSDVDSDANYTSIDYAIFNEASTIKIYETGTLRSTPTLSPVFATTDLWRVEKDYYGVVRYYRNPAGTGSWTLLYTSTTAANQTVPYYYDTTIYHASQTINDAYLYGAACEALPSPWVLTDIGSPALAGSAAYANSQFTLSGAGTDIWDTSDQFSYINQSASGDSDMSLRVDSQGNTNGWAKGGIMYRESSAAGSTFVMLVITPSNGLNFQYRSTTNGSASTVSLGAYTLPQYIKLTRVGNTFTAYKSSDGSTWGSALTSISVTMASGINMGMAVTSHNAASSSPVIFSTVVANP